MLVIVAGLERFVGDMKRCYRGGLHMTDTPDIHHDAFAANLERCTLVDSGVTSKQQSDLVAEWERDPRTLVADMLRLFDGRISYRLYEVTPHGR